MNSAKSGIISVGGGPGVTKRKAALVTVRDNVACNNATTDLYGVGGFLGDDLLPATQGTGNVVQGEFTNKFATTRFVEHGVTGNTANILPAGNQACPAVMIASVPPVIRVGENFVIEGSGFTAGSDVCNAKTRKRRLGASAAPDLRSYSNH